MRKIFPLQIPGRHPDRVMDALRHEIRKYLKRERRRELPAGADFWDFDCRCGSSREGAESVHLASLFACIDAVAAAQGAEVYVEILARPAQRRAITARRAEVDGGAEEGAVTEGR
ncbi:DUF6172 family protein [Xenophilus sp. Marseille-Q4582]|uniref:DUF6172 family protein n=1 Tax=Xenophilus sp. Marseille-Q4582 TaxID=2866600 RepID=UPI001CE467A6|nr:DUF6172 family protein [Xenophilus sp. Marseille-Q4582]